MNALDLAEVPGHKSCFALVDRAIGIALNLRDPLAADEIRIVRRFHQRPDAIGLIRGKFTCNCSSPLKSVRSPLGVVNLQRVAGLKHSPTYLLVRSCVETNAKWVADLYSV